MKENFTYGLTRGSGACATLYSTFAGDKPTNFCRASVVNVFLKKENAAKGNLAANAHWSKLNAVLAFDLFLNHGFNY